MSMNYFNFAANLMRDEAAATGKMSDEWMEKWKASHRKPSKDSEVTRTEADAQEMQSFAQAEDLHINQSGAW